jgi:hypothetical protein
VWTGPNYFSVIFGDVDGNGGAGTCAFEIKNGAGSNIVVSVAKTTALPVGQWQLLALTYDSALGSNHMKVFVNGVQQGQANAVGVNYFNSGAWVIGDVVSGSDLSATFAISDIRISNVARTAGYWLAMYNAANP